MLNCITIHGRLTADPELKTTQSGVPSCRFTVAVDRSYSKGEKMTDFFSVVCWRGLAETVAKYFHKGKEIVVRGEMQSRKWTDKEGVNRVSWEVMADSVDFCGSKSDNGTTAEPAKSETKPKADFAAIERDDDLPF